MQVEPDQQTSAIANPNCGSGRKNNFLPIAIGISSYNQLYIFNQQRLSADGTFGIPNLHKALT